MLEESAGDSWVPNHISVEVFKAFFMSFRAGWLMQLANRAGDQTSKSLPPQVFGEKRKRWGAAKLLLHHLHHVSIRITHQETFFETELGFRNRDGSRRDEFVIICGANAQCQCFGVVENQSGLPMNEIIGACIIRIRPAVTRGAKYSRNSMPGPWGARRPLMCSLAPKTLLRCSCSVP